ncbi:hypothetical protein [Carboxydothermus hydrogenoformans]|uniref:Uncharacterized protein n=1 Tax=Carboxydothermus hydrogenoformans (strain ATCC BAA-161 / DSM 6008 / Z-2901) TaxID=246194 RepID=Q3AG20_CARHZ|nr:hypothetical protein [Carboxydothermus hydrogenoformans]ABB15643.1 conserved hypothetical protein [Carboxydothermus hydrogenoformans Z-2901]
MRIVEAFIGEYASGKSENAVNRALELKNQGRTVNLVDLDTVEPFYTLTPIKKELEALGLKVLAWERDEALGFGETGVLLKPEIRWALRYPGDVIFDVGYGVHGSRSLNLIEGIWQEPNLKVYTVINASRPMTREVDDIVEHVKSLGRVDGLINNTHLGDETTWDVICDGEEKVLRAAKILGLPVLWTAVDQKLINGNEEMLQKLKTPVKGLVRYMPKTFW